MKQSIQVNIRKDNEIGTKTERNLIRYDISKKEIEILIDKKIADIYFGYIK